MSKSATEIGEAVAGAALIVAGGVLLAYGGAGAPLIVAGIGLEAGAAAQALAPTPQLGGARTGPSLNRSPTVPPEYLIYGRVAIPGTPAYLTYTADQIHDAPDREYVSAVYLLTRRRVLDGLEGIWIGGELVELEPNTGLHRIDHFPEDELAPIKGSKYRGFISVHFEPGDGSAGPWQWLLDRSGGDWTEDHALTSIAWVGVTWQFDPKLWPNDLPENPLFQVRGFKCFDPVTGLTRWTQNAALCWRDALVAVHGPRGGVDSTLIESPTLIAARNVCDEVLTKTGGDTVRRYECNGAFDASEDWETIEEQLLSCFGGTRVKTGATWYVYAGAARPIAMDLTPDDLAGPASISPKRAEDDLINTSHAVYLNAAAGYVDGMTPDYPPPGDNAYQDADSGLILTRELQLRAVTSSEQAQRLVKIDLEQNRRQITWTALFKDKARLLRSMNVITYTDAALGWDHKPFLIAHWELKDPDEQGRGGGVQLSLAEYDDAVFAWDASEEQAEAGSGEAGAGLPPPLPTIAPVLLDMPVYTMADAQARDFGFYAGYRVTDPSVGFLSTTPTRLHRADTQAGEYQSLAFFDRPLVAGLSTTSLAAGVLGLRNRGASVTVQMDLDWQLTSASDAELLNGANLAYLGDQGTGGRGEILQFATATSLGSRLWRLSDLRRGLLGTEQQRTHASGRLLVLLTPALHRIPDDAPLHDVVRWYRLAYLSRPTEAGSEVAFTNHARGRLPIPPLDARLTTKGDGSGDLRVSWNGRVRGLLGWLDPAPLPESRLSYKLFLSPPLAGSKTVFVYDEEFWDYAAADQATDFGSPQTSLSLAIAQRDDGIGNGDTTSFSLSVSGTH
jgi:hypothetical protein